MQFGLLQGDCAGLAIDTKWNGGLLLMQWRFHEFDDELWHSEWTLLFFEEIYQALPSLFGRRSAAMRSKFLLHISRLSFLLRYVQLQELDVMRHWRGCIALRASIIETQCCFNRIINDIMRSQRTPPIEKIPLVMLISNWRVKQCFFIDQPQQMNDDLKGILPSIPQQSWHFFVQQLAYGLSV